MLLIIMCVILLLLGEGDLLACDNLSMLGLRSGGSSACGCLVGFVWRSVLVAL